MSTSLQSWHARKGGAFYLLVTNDVEAVLELDVPVKVMDILDVAFHFWCLGSQGPAPFSAGVHCFLGSGLRYSPPESERQMTLFFAFLLPARAL